MASSHQLAIAKASLAAGLLRADPTPVAREEISQFHSLLDKALAVCSPTNIQKCKRWILKNMGSQARVAALGRYLATLSPSLLDSSTEAGRRLSARRKRLHVLYLLNDLLYHAKYHEPAETFASAIQEHVRPVLASALYPKAEKQLAKVQRLLKIWEEKAYYPRAFLAELDVVAEDIASGREPSSTSTAVEDASRNGGSNSQQKKKMVLLPSTHGDPSIPFYDLPAANLLPHITTNVPDPINPRLVKPIQFPHITPDPGLVEAVDKFLVSVDAMFAGKEDPGDPDPVGGFLKNKEGEGYYGWSREFCEKMKEKRNERGRSRSGTADRRKEGTRGRWRRSYSSYSSSRSRSRSRSRSPDYRRRSPSTSRSGSRRRSQSPARSRPSFKPASSAPEPAAAAAAPPAAGMQYGYQPPPPPPPPTQYQPQQQQFSMNLQNWLAPALPGAGGMPLPPHPNQLMQLQQQLQQQYGFQQLQAAAGHAWKQQQQQQQSPPNHPPPDAGHGTSGQTGPGYGTDPRQR